MLPVVKVVGGAINLLPAEILKNCKSGNIDDIINKLRELKEKVEKNSTATQVINDIVKEIKKVPGLAFIAGIADIPAIIRKQIAKRIGDLIEKLKELREKCE